MPWYPFKLTGRVFVDNEDDAINRVDNICSNSGLIHVVRIEMQDQVQIENQVDLGCLQGRYMDRQGEK